MPADGLGRCRKSRTSARPAESSRTISISVYATYTFDQALGRTDRVASLRSGTRRDVAYWHKADNPIAPAFVRFWTKADKIGFWPAMVCQLLTQRWGNRPAGV